MLTYVIFILKDKKYYGVPSTKLAEELGTMALWGEVISIILCPFIGLVFDTFGRKLPVIISLIMISFGIAIIPLFHDVYPWFFVARTLVVTSTVVGLDVPLLPDYV